MSLQRMRDVLRQWHRVAASVMWPGFLTVTSPNQTQSPMLDGIELGGGF
jgi:hypothetical protein